MKLAEIEDADRLVTKEDLKGFATKDDIRDLKAFIMEREVLTLRWTMGLLAIYFFGTLASVWYVVSVQLGTITQLLQHYRQ
jgi:hypothetical protein